MRILWGALLLVAGLARGEVFPLRSGWPVTGELARIEQGRLVIRTRQGVSTFAPRELPRAWTDEHWQRLGLASPPRRGVSLSDTWRGFFRAESMPEAVSYLHADPEGAGTVAACLLFLGLWFCFQGRRFTRWGGLPVVALWLLLIAGLVWFARHSHHRVWPLMSWNQEERDALFGWWIIHYFLFLLSMSESRRFRPRRGWAWMLWSVGRTSWQAGLTVRMALFGDLFIVQGLWLAGVGCFGVGEGELWKLFLVCLPLAIGCSVAGSMLQLPVLALEMEQGNR